MDCIVSGQLLLPHRPQSVTLVPGTLTVRGDRIASINTGLHAHPDFGGPEHLISPGFVDTHVHLPQFDSIGADGMELLDWLDRVIFPAEAKWADADIAGAMATRAAKELLSFGTTSVAAYATSHHAGARAAIEALADAGMGGYVGQVLMDRNAPSELLVPAKESLASAARLAPRGRIVPAVTPRFAITSTEELLQGAGDLARKTGSPIQTHLSETSREVERVSELFNGRSYVDVYKQAGLLGPRSILGHGIWLGDGDHRVLNESGAVVAHCPTANRFLEAGEMDRARALAAGVRASLGSDVAAGPDRSMIRVARAMIDTAKQVRQGRGANPTPKGSGEHRGIPDAAECWWQVTAGNADAMGLAETGRLGTGMWADLAVIRPAHAWLRSPDPLAAVLYAWDDRWLEATLVGGRIGYRMG
jgi:guanine deaminase